MKHTVTSLGAAVVLAVGLLATGTTTASAAMPTCTGANTYVDAVGYTMRMPTDYEDGSNFCVMGRGATGNGVEALQWTMHFCYGQINLAKDGIFGPGTEAALKKVQASEGLVADGVYGPNTRDRIKHHWEIWDQGIRRCLRMTQAPGPIRG
ncbi:peptidoglycan-binding domain-containing protein [Streptomyces sp. NBC_00691]|uniref:peptidoglycan-binding domain-containing protein n=1 Tax=Streptomyces sp. NBC_00691 TaxID=2903671 RepID=UPI002E370497|nr:peptidoglycan-binding domain-containing protein [Streptomyces sp. NBC_00691]